MDAIITYELSKQYNTVPALCGVNLQIPEGQAYACVGGERSGKTTLVRLLSGFCRPTTGECSVLGLSPFFETGKLHAVMGAVLDTARLYENMTLSQNLIFFAGLSGVDENDAIDRSSFLLHKLDIWEGRDERVDDLPTSVVRRASLARALVHSPRILLVDEPAMGMAQEAEDSVREMISYLVREEGVTVLFCTRNMDYAQQLCTGFALLNNGSLIAKGSMENLRRGAGVKCRAVLRCGGEASPLNGFREENGLWIKDVASEAEMPKLISRTVGEGVEVYEAKFEEPTLEEIYTAYLEGGIQRAGVSDEQDEGCDDRQDGEESETVQTADRTAANGSLTAEDRGEEQTETTPEKGANV